MKINSLHVKGSSVSLSNIRVELARLWIVVTALCMTGCVTSINALDYPKEWPKQKMNTANKCPDIHGTYLNTGEIIANFDHLQCHKTSKFNGNLTWSCKDSLLDGLGVSSDQGGEVRIEQPNDQLMEVTEIFSDNTNNRFELKRGDDFTCDDGKLTFSKHGSWFPGPTALLGVVILSGGYLGHSRSITKADDDSLIMTVVEDIRAFTIVFPIPIHGSATAYVRWRPTRRSPGSPQQHDAVGDRPVSSSGRGQ